MSAFSSTLLFAAVWLHLYMNISARYDRIPHVAQYEVPPEVVNQDDKYNELKYAEMHGGYLESWPWSSEVQEIVYDKPQSQSDEIFKGIPSNVDEAPGVVVSAEHLPIPMALESNGKISPAKKNLYMSRCSFKICNMGRKRNARFLRLYDIMENLRSTRSLEAKPAM